MEDQQPAPRRVPLQSIQPPKLRVFTGDESIGAFLDDARRLFAAFDFPELAEAEFVIQSLGGRAKAEVLARPAAERASGPMVLDVLADTFTDEDDLSLLRAFHSRRQGLGETVLDFAQEMERLTSSVNGHTAGTVTPVMLRDRFVDGLHPSLTPSH